MEYYTKCEACKGDGENRSQYISGTDCHPCKGQGFIPVEAKTPTDEEVSKQALFYAKEHSSAPDKCTPDWIIQDFKAGFNYCKSFYLLSQSPPTIDGEAIKFAEWLAKNDWHYLPHPKQWCSNGRLNETSQKLLEIFNTKQHE